MGGGQKRGGGGEEGWGSEMYPVRGRSLSHDGLNDLPQRKVRVQARTCRGSVAGLRDQGRTPTSSPPGPARGGSRHAGEFAVFGHLRRRMRTFAIYASNDNCFGGICT